MIEEDFKKLDKYIVCLYKNEHFSDDFNFKITESIPFILKIIFEYYQKIKNTYISNKCVGKKGIKEHKKIMNEISKEWTETQHSFYRFFFNEDDLIEFEEMRFYIVELMLPFIDEKKEKNSKILNIILLKIKTKLHVSNRNSIFNANIIYLKIFMIISKCLNL